MGSYDRRAHPAHRPRRFLLVVRIEASVAGGSFVAIPVARKPAAGAGVAGRGSGGWKWRYRSCRSYWAALSALSRKLMEAAAIVGGRFALRWLGPTICDNRC